MHHLDGTCTWARAHTHTGGPGSGKGTQCNKIAEGFGFLHLCAGDLLRAEVAEGTKQGKTLEVTMKEGKLVPAVRVHWNHNSINTLFN